MITMIKRKKKRFPPKRFPCTHAHTCMHWGLDQSHSYETLIERIYARARQSQRVSERACISTWFGLVKRLATFKTATCERNQEVHCEKPVSFIFVLFAFAFFSRSVSLSFFRIFCSVALRIDAAVFFVGSSQNATLRSTAVAPMLYIENVSLCFVFHFSSFIWFANRQRS